MKGLEVARKVLEVAGKVLEIAGKVLQFTKNICSQPYLQFVSSAKGFCHLRPYILPDITPERTKRNL